MKFSRKIFFILFLTFFQIFHLCFVIEAVNSVRDKNFGVIVISHGAPVKIWNQMVLKLIGSVESPYPLEAAFLDYDEERTLEKTISRLEDRDIKEILVIHLSPSSYSVHHEEVKYLVGLRKDLGIYTEEVDKPINSKVEKFVVSPCMDDHPIVVEILTDYAKELSEDSEHESLILLGHGPVEELMNIMWVRQLKRIGKAIRKELKFREIVCMTLRNDSSDLIREQAFLDLKDTTKRLSTQGRVIIVSYALGAGMVQKEVKHILGHIPSVAISTKGVASHPNTRKWIEETIRKGMNQPIVPPINRDWSHYDDETGKPIGTHRYGFL